MPLFEVGEDRDLNQSDKREYMEQMRRAEIDFAGRLRRMLREIEGRTAYMKELSTEDRQISSVESR
jgi:hypothetical protein